jgi:hypothetical protein
MIYFESYQVFLVNSLAVPRLGNVQLRFHFLRRGTNGVIVPQENLEGKLEFNVADLASGVYLVKVQLSDDTVITKRFIKQ